VSSLHGVAVCEWCDDEIMADDSSREDDFGYSYHTDCYDIIYAECPRCKGEAQCDRMDTIPDYDPSYKKYCEACVEEYEETERRVRDSSEEWIREETNETFESGWS
jgi:hypothetical protein